MATAPEWDSAPTRAVRKPVNNPNWGPIFGPAQQVSFDDCASFVLVYGEKGSGKTYVGLHALVRHCYENKNALALIIACSIFTGKEGALYDLVTHVLPVWRDGNRHSDWLDGKPNPLAGQLIDTGIGLDFSDPKQDPDTKDRVLWISNCHGGWSKVILKSIPYADAVEDRIKGPTPSFILAEEITNMSSDEYFIKPALQLGRRRSVEGVQQYYGTCNPDGPSHWVYKKWFEECIDEKTGRRDTNFSVHHIPLAQNLRFINPRYAEQFKALKDPIEIRRLVHGEWVDRPTGESIFGNYYQVEIHVRGNALKSIGLSPIKALPVIVGIDPGPRNYSMHLLQMVPTKERTFWMAFDEINLVGNPDQFSGGHTAASTDGLLGENDGASVSVHVRGRRGGVLSAQQRWQLRRAGIAAVRQGTNQRPRLPQGEGEREAANQHDHLHAHGGDAVHLGHLSAHNGHDADAVEREAQAGRGA